MYTIKQYPDKKFLEKMDLIRFIKKNYEELKKIKMSEYKTCSEVLIKGESIKEYEPVIEDITTDTIHVKSVINTTNIIDGHLDMHMPKIWNKTVKDNPYTYHLKEHERKFESVISNKAKNYNESNNFNKLGLNVDFKTTANINEFTLNKNKLPVMFDAYKNGDVKQHSVGMLYVSLDLAYYDEESEKNMTFFEDMKSMAVNPEVAEETGYFWVVYEAKKREGSAVIFGSNSVTPTIYVKNYEPSENTRKDEPLNSTHNKRKYLLI